MQKKTKIATTAFLTVLMTLGIFIPIFWFNSNASPLGKTIIKYFVYPDGTPIGECLAVELWNEAGGDQPLMVGHTDIDGKVVFAGLHDGTFTIQYNWQSVLFKETARINCSQIIWEFTNVVEDWEICKTFYYAESKLSISHLNVSLYKDSEFIAWKLTNEVGTVCFGDLKAGSYTLEWVWGGIGKSEAVIIGFQEPTPILLTNYLEPKSGGG